MAENTGGGLGDLLNPIGLGLGVLQTGLGIIQGISARKRMKKLQAQQKAYETPDEIFKILQATQANAQQGYDPTTLSYLTNQTDQAFSSSIGAANRLGADPNDLSAIFGQKVNAIMKIGAENHALNMQNFDKVLGALGNVAANKAAEQKSRQDILNSQMQSAGADMQAGTGNVSGGINTLLATLSADKIAQLYNPDGTPKKKATSILGATQAGSLLPDNSLAMGTF